MYVCIPTDDGGCECEIKNGKLIARSIFIDERCVDLTKIKFRDQKMSGKVLCTLHLFICLRVMDNK